MDMSVRCSSGFVLVKIIVLSLQLFFRWSVDQTWPRTFHVFSCWQWTFIRSSWKLVVEYADTNGPLGEATSSSNRMRSIFCQCLAWTCEWAQQIAIQPKFALRVGHMFDVQPQRCHLLDCQRRTLFRSLIGLCAAAMIAHCAHVARRKAKVAAVRSAKVVRGVDSREPGLAS